MKILVVSLLRLGDFLQVLPVLPGLQRRYPGARIDVLTHKPVRALQPMMPEYGKWWTIDRDELQAGLGRADIPLLTSFDVLKEQMDRVSAENYDLVINLTQTVFSGHLMGYIEARAKLGLTIDVQGRALFHSPWFRYLDERAERPAADIFNYTDIFHQACDLDGERKIWPLKPTAQGNQEVADLALDAEHPVLTVQLLTSDTKKTWPEEHYVRCLNELKKIRPHLQIVVLGAPSEAEAVSRVANQVSARSAILSLDGALALLERSQILLTGDTSIKHLANAARCDVIELALGSSDVLRTGTYKEESLIVHSDLPCAPCAHANPCSQIAQLCALQVAPVMLAQVIDRRMAADWASLSQLAKMSAPVRIKRTRHLESGFWFAADLTAQLSSVDQILDRCTWKMFLNQEHKQKVTAFGSQSVFLSNELERLLPGEARAPLLEHLDFLESHLAESVDVRFEREPTPASSLIDLSELRRVQIQAVDRARQSEIKIKLIRSLKSRLMEST